MDPFLGEIRIFAGNFAPQGWAFCAGQLMAISQNDALYALIGTTYGGDGVTTFGLPDLRGRAPIHQGTRFGVTFTMGEVIGVENVTLTTQQLPQHTHPAVAATGADSISPQGKVWSTDPGANIADWATAASSNAFMAPNAISTAGGNLPHENMQPFLAISYIIAIEGIFPSQN
jgi:microcystin-dependent protein